MITALRATLTRLPSSIVVYDIETSGLSPEFDQIVQIAALRTDHALAEPIQSEAVLELRARRQPWIVPSPGAMLVTRADPALLSSGRFHHEMMAKAEEFMSSRPSLFLTYNGIKFDERFLRNSLFRSLCRPYLTQAKGSMRADLMIMTQAISILDPSVLVVPTADSGRPTFRLGEICRANGIEFPEDTAHDALADVRATLALARYLKEVSPLAFDQTLALADKWHAASILKPGKAIYRLAVYGGRPSIRTYGVLDQVEDDPNGRVCIDLTEDPDNYVGLDADRISKWMAKRPSPLTVLRINAHEMVLPLDSDMFSHLHPLIRCGAKDQQPPPADLMRERALWIAAENQFIDHIHTALATQKDALEPSPHVEAQLYSGGFAPDTDFIRARRILVNEEMWPQLTESLSDPRLREFASRLLYETSAHDLDESSRSRLAAWTCERLLGPADAPWRTLAAAREEIVKLSTSADAVDQMRINEIAAWLNSIEAEALGRR